MTNVEWVLVLGIVVAAGMFLAKRRDDAAAELPALSSTWWFEYSGTLAPRSPGAEAEFEFPVAPNAAHYLLTHPREGLARRAVVTVEAASAAVFDFHTNPDNTGTDPSSFGFFIQRAGDQPVAAPDGKFEFYRWWCVKRMPLAPGRVELSADLGDPTSWISVFGKSAASYPEQFDEAVRDLRAEGFTFGGGSFYGHGVFVAPGSGPVVFRIEEFA